MPKQYSTGNSPGELTFSSSEVCQATGVTPRQLQWWDEHQVVRPARRGNKRSYRSEDVLAVLVAAEMRRKSLSLQKIRRALRALRREVERAPGEVLGDDADCFLITDGYSARLESRRDGVIDVLIDTRRPMWLVSVSRQAAKLRKFEQKLRAERAAADAKKPRSTDRQLALFPDPR